MRTVHVVVLLSAVALSAFADDPLTSAVDRSTPAASVQGFFDHAHSGDYATAARFLNLDHTPKDKRALEGPRLARRLRFVLDRKLFIDYSTLSHEEAGAPADGKTETLGTLQLKNVKQPIRLQRVPSEDGPAWVFSDDTVRSIDRLYQEFGPPFGETLPAFWFDSHFLGLELWQWFGLLAVLLAATIVGWVLGKVIILIAERMAKLTAWGWDERIIVGARGPVRLVVWCVIVAAGTRLLFLTPMAQLLLDLVARSTLILAITLFALRAITAVSNYVHTEVKGTAEGIERARRLRTQVAVLKGVLQVAIYVIAAALLLMQFAVVRSVGVSLLASAGIAGLVIGLAAQKSISNLLAGIQLSLTQPIQIGESIVVEGEFGVVEEIRLTYVVISVWDGRRLIIPITQFLDKPFQNWSRARNGMLGTVELHVDFRVDVEAVRVEVTRLLNNEAKSLWNGRVQTVAITNSSDKTMLLRVLASSSDPDALFDLRCMIREKLIAFLSKQPQWLPVVRSEAQPVPALASGRLEAPQEKTGQA